MYIILHIGMDVLGRVQYSYPIPTPYCDNKHVWIHVMIGSRRNPQSNFLAAACP